MQLTEISDARSVVFDAAIDKLKPVERLTTSQWADKYRVLVAEGSQEAGRWSTDRNPLLREIQDEMGPFGRCKELYIRKCSQFGVTEAVLNAIGCRMTSHPGPMMVLLPTIENKESWVDQKLSSLTNGTPVIRKKMGGIKIRDKSQNKNMISAPGFILFLAGGNSPNSYAQKTVEFLVLDDYSRFPAVLKNEGSTNEVAKNRTKSYQRTGKNVFISTPTVEGACLVSDGFEQSDQRHAWYSCPHCNELQKMHLERLKIEENHRKAYYVCENGCIIEEHEKPAMLRKAVWIPEFPEREIRGYQIDSFCCNIGIGPSWYEYASKYQAACRDEEKMHAFRNQYMGLPYKDSANKLDEAEMQKAASAYSLGQIPVGCLALTVGVDTQDEWLDVSIIGWGDDKKLWLIDTIELVGNTSRQQVWDDLHAYLHRVRKNSFGITVPLRAVAIDSGGHRGVEVADFVSRSDLKMPVYAIKGASGYMARPIAQKGSDPTRDRQGKVVRSGYKIWQVGTIFCKSYIYGQLAADASLPEHERNIHFPAGLTIEYYNSLLSEVYDRKVHRYVQKVGAKYKRNEKIDEFGYAYAIGHHPQVLIGLFKNGKPKPAFWDNLRATLEPSGEVVDATTDEAIRVPSVSKPAVSSGGKINLNHASGGRFAR